MPVSRGGRDQRYTLCSNGIVKTNSKKPLLNWSWEALCGSTLHSLTLTINCLKQEETYFLSPTGRCFYTLVLHQEGGSSPHPATTQPMKNCYNSANEQPLYFKSPVSSNRLFVYNSPLEILLSSIKEHYSCMWFTIRLHVSNHNSLLLQNKPFC